MCSQFNLLFIRNNNCYSAGLIQKKLGSASAGVAVVFCEIVLRKLKVVGNFKPILIQCHISIPPENVRKP